MIACSFGFFFNNSCICVARTAFGKATGMRCYLWFQVLNCASRLLFWGLQRFLIVQLRECSWTRHLSIGNVSRQYTGLFFCCSRLYCFISRVCIPQTPFWSYQIGISYYYHDLVRNFFSAFGNTKKKTSTYSLKNCKSRQEPKQDRYTLLMTELNAIMSLLICTFCYLRQPLPYPASPLNHFFFFLATWYVRTFVSTHRDASVLYFVIIRARAASQPRHVWERKRLLLLDAFVLSGAPCSVLYFAIV